MIGKHLFSEKEIVVFAKQFDPLPFHTDPSIANQGFFQGLVTSGSQAFMYFYPKYWVPKFGSTVLAGLELNNWKFKKPIYAGDEITAYTKIIQLEEKEDQQIILWNFYFKNVKNETVQSLDLKILHRIH